MEEGGGLSGLQVKERKAPNYHLLWKKAYFINTIFQKYFCNKKPRYLQIFWWKFVNLMFANSKLYELKSSKMLLQKKNSHASFFQYCFLNYFNIYILQKVFDLDKDFQILEKRRFGSGRFYHITYVFILILC